MGAADIPLVRTPDGRHSGRMIRFFAAIAVAVMLPALALAAPSAGDFMEKATPSGGPPDDTVFVFLSTMGGDDAPAQAYIELPRTQPVDGLITVWTATVPPADKPVAGYLGWIMLERMSFDCVKHLHRWSGGIVLDGQGRVVVSDGQKDWEVVEPKSVNDDALKLACGRSDPPDELVMGVAAVRADAAKRYREN